jgi:hypothetical protein
MACRPKGFFRYRINDGVIKSTRANRRWAVAPSPRAASGAGLFPKRDAFLGVPHKVAYALLSVFCDRENARPTESATSRTQCSQSVVVGTQNQNSFGGYLHVLHGLPDLCGSSKSWYSALVASANHDRKWKVKMAPVVTDTFDGSARIGHGVSSKTDAYGLVDFYGNSSIGVGLQQGYGGGISILLHSTDCSTAAGKNYRLAVSGDLGVRYLHQRLYAPGPTRSFIGIRPSLDLTY